MRTTMLLVLLIGNALVFKLSKRRIQAIALH